MLRRLLTLLLALQLALAPTAQAPAAANGGNFGDAFKGSFINSVVSLGLADVQTGIGHVFNDANGNPINGGEGSLGHVMLHAMAGCVAAEAQGADCGSGAAGGIAGAVYSGMQKAPVRGSYASDAAYQAAFASWKTDVLAKGEIASLMAAYVFSGGKAENVSAAVAIGKSAVSNNYLTHAQIESMIDAYEACNGSAACQKMVLEKNRQLSLKQEHDMAMCGNNLACLAPHIVALANSVSSPEFRNFIATNLLGNENANVQQYLTILDAVQATSLAAYGLAGNDTQAEAFAYAYSRYPEWAGSNCTGLTGVGCMERFQTDQVHGWGGMVHGYHSSNSATLMYTMAIGGTGGVLVARSALVGLSNCYVNPICAANLPALVAEAGLGLSGATAGQTFFTVSATGALAGRLVLKHGTQILVVVDDLGRILRPVSQVPDDLGRFLVTTPEGVTGYLDGGRFVRDMFDFKRGVHNGHFDAISPGPLSDNLSGTFTGGRYAEVTLTEDVVLYRAGTADSPLGQFFSQEPSQSVIQARIDRAILPEWPNGKTSPIDTVFSVRIPTGTKVYVGEISSQGGFYVGGTQQVLIPTPWSIPGVQVVGSSSLP